MTDIQRFKAALVTGRSRPDNPEALVRDNGGDYVTYKDCKAITNEAIQIINDLCIQYNHPLPLPLATLERLDV